MEQQQVVTTDIDKLLVKSILQVGQPEFNQYIRNAVLLHFPGANESFSAALALPNTPNNKATLNYFAYGCVPNFSEALLALESTVTDENTKEWYLAQALLEFPRDHPEACYRYSLLKNVAHNDKEDVLRAGALVFPIPLGSGRLGYFVHVGVIEALVKILKVNNPESRQERDELCSRALLYGKCTAEQEKFFISLLKEPIIEFSVIQKKTDQVVATSAKKEEPQSDKAQEEIKITKTTSVKIKNKRKPQFARNNVFEITEEIDAEQINKQSALQLQASESKSDKVSDQTTTLINYLSDSQEVNLAHFVEIIGSLEATKTTKRNNEKIKKNIQLHQNKLSALVSQEFASSGFSDEIKKIITFCSQRGSFGPLHEVISTVFTNENKLDQPDKEIKFFAQSLKAAFADPSAAQSIKNLCTYAQTIDDRSAKTLCVNLLFDYAMHKKNNVELFRSAVDLVGEMIKQDATVFGGMFKRLLENDLPEFYERFQVMLDNYAQHAQSSNEVFTFAIAEYEKKINRIAGADKSASKADRLFKLAALVKKYEHKAVNAKETYSRLFDTAAKNSNFYALERNYLLMDNLDENSIDKLQVCENISAEFKRILSIDEERNNYFNDAANRTKILRAWCSCAKYSVPVFSQYFDFLENLVLKTSIDDALVGLRIAQEQLGGKNLNLFVWLNKPEYPDILKNLTERELHFKQLVAILLQHFQLDGQGPTFSQLQKLEKQCSTFINQAQDQQIKSELQALHEGILLLYFYHATEPECFDKLSQIDQNGLLLYRAAIVALAEYMTLPETVNPIWEKYLNSSVAKKNLFAIEFAIHQAKPSQFIKANNCDFVKEAALLQERRRLFGVIRSILKEGTIEDKLLCLQIFKSFNLERELKDGLALVKKNMSIGENNISSYQRELFSEVGGEPYIGELTDNKALTAKLIFEINKCGRYGKLEERFFQDLKICLNKTLPDSIKAGRNIYDYASLDSILKFDLVSGCRKLISSNQMRIAEILFSHWCDLYNTTKFQIFTSEIVNTFRAILMAMDPIKDQLFFNKIYGLIEPLLSDKLILTYFNKSMIREFEQNRIFYPPGITNDQLSFLNAMEQSVNKALDMERYSVSTDTNESVVLLKDISARIHIARARLSFEKIRKDD